MNSMKSIKSQQSGFTLVEIAIVLVIIGLLLGGILKGQELINSAMTIKTTTEMDLKIYLIQVVLISTITMSAMLISFAMMV